MSVALVAHETPSPPSVDLLSPHINKQQKAAVLLSILLGTDATPNLDHIGTASLKNVVDIMASFGEVDRSTVDNIILEFLSELQDFGLSMRGDLEETITSLSGHISDKSLSNIRKAYVHSPEIDVWVRVATAEVDQIQQALVREHLQIGAVVLSKLPSALSARILGGMNAVRARETMLAIINSKEIAAEILETIGQSFSDTLFLEDSPSVFSKSPVERAGEIMNFAQSEIRDRLMDEFGKENPDTAEKIRKLMFTFPDIPDRIQPRDVSAITRTVPPETLLMALKNAPVEAEFLLSSLSSRVAEQLREEIAESEAVKQSDAEAAQLDLIAGIRELEANGSITLLTEED